MYLAFQGRVCRSGPYIRAMSYQSHETGSPQRLISFISLASVLATWLPIHF